MPVSVDDVLKHAQKVKYIIECNLPNSIPHKWDMKDHVSGDTPLGMSGDTSVYRTNSFVRIGTESVVNGAVMPLMLSGMTIDTSLGEPFEGSGASRSIARFAVINNRTGDPDFDAEAEQKLSDLSDRRFKGYDCTVKIGGFLYQGTPDEIDMDYDDFVTYLDGRFTSFSLDDDVIDLSVESRQDDLKGLFPTDTYIAGPLEGQAKPFGFGEYLGYPCRSLPNGRWQFHDEVFTSADTVYSKTNYPPFAHFGYGKIFAGTDSGDSLFKLGYLATPAYALDASGYVSVDRSDYAYTNNGAQTVDLAGPYPASISIDGDGVELVANSDHSFNIKRVEGEGYNTYGKANFVWSQESSTRAVTNRAPKVVCETTGDVNFEMVRNGAVRIRANGTGSVTFTFEDKIANAIMNVRAVRNPIQVADNFSPVPETIVPPFDGNPHNNKVIFYNVADNTISFDYTSTNDAFIMAVWFDSITLYKPLESKLTISSESTLSEIDFAIQETNGISVNNIHQDFTESGTHTKTYSIVSETQDINLDIQTDYGSVQCWLDNGKISERTYGTFIRDNKLVFAPDPEETFGGGLVTRGGGCYATLESKYMSSSKFLFRARIKSGAQDELIIEAGSRDVQTINDDGNSIGQPRVKIGREWKDFEIKSDVSGSSGQLFTEVGLFRAGTVSGNPDEDYSVEVERITVVEETPTEGAVTAIVTINNTDVRLPTYRVDDVGNFSDLPEGIALYDTFGIILTSTNYRAVRADVNLGSINSIAAFRRISVLSKGEDLITCDFTGEAIGVPIDKQSDWINHVGEMCNGLDYYWYENLVGNGITVKQRWRMGDPVSGTIPQNPIISVKRSNSAPRQSQYIVEYQKNYGDNSKTKTTRSNFGFLGEAEPKTISTVLVNKADAKEIDNQIGRDSIENDLWEIVVQGIGWGVLVGQAWFFQHHRLPKVVPCLIRDVSVNDEDSPPKTRFLVKILRTD